MQALEDGVFSTRWNVWNEALAVCLSWWGGPPRGPVAPDRCILVRPQIQIEVN